MHLRYSVTPAQSFSPLTADDIADIAQMFNQSPRDRAIDERDLRASMNGKINLTVRVLPGHTS
jgi:hypothetical protein